MGKQALEIISTYIKTTDINIPIRDVHHILPCQSRYDSPCERQDADTRYTQGDNNMKYAAMLIAIVTAFIAGTQISRANSFTINAVMNHQNESSLMDSMASEWLVPDNVNRMMAYHKALNK